MKYYAIIFAWLLFACTNAFAQLKANAGPDIEICEGYSVRIGQPATGGKPPYKYRWAPVNGLDNSTFESPVVTPTQSITEYSVMVTDESGLTSFDTVIVQRNPSPRADAGSDLTTCIGANVTLGGVPSAFFGTPPFTYKWSFLPANIVNPNSSNPTYIAERTGYTRHVLQVIDAKGCESTSDIVVTINQPVQIKVGSNITICANTPKQVGFYGMAKSDNGTIQRYQWTPSFGLSSDNIANPFVFPSTTTKYYITAFDALGCQSTDSIVVNVKPSMQISLKKDTTLCPNKDMQLAVRDFVSGGIPPYKYRWVAKDDLGNIDYTFKDSTIETPIIQAKKTRVYEVIVTDNQGCIARSSIQVTVKDASAAVFTPPDEICQEVVLDFSTSKADGLSYQWSVSGADGEFLEGSDKSAIKIVWHGSGTSVLTLKVTDNFKGCESSGSATIKIKPFPKPVISNLGRSVLCPGESTQIELDKDYLNTYWSSGQTKVRSITVSRAGTYYVNVQDSNGCTNKSNAIIVYENPKPDPTILGITKLCPNTVISLKAINPKNSATFYKSYQWSTGETTPEIIVSKSGSYTVTVTDTADCPAISPIHTIVDNPLNVKTQSVTFLDLETEFDYPTQTVWYMNSDDEDLVLTNYAFVTPIAIPELAIESINIEGRPVSVNNISGQVLKVGEKINFELKFTPLIPDSITYSIVLNVSSPCTTYNPVTIPIRAESYDKRMTSIASVNDVTAATGAENVHIPLMIKFVNEEDSVVNASLEAKVRINSRLFDPKFITNGKIIRHDTTADYWHSLWLRFDNITIRNTNPILLTDIVGTTLATTFFQDSMFLDKIIWDPATVVKIPRVRLSNGILKLTPYCFPRNVVIFEKEKTTIKINPNPSTDVVKVYINTNVPGEYKIETYSTTGAKLITKKITLDKGSSVISYEAEDLSSGVYPVIVSTPTHVEILNLVIDK